MRVVRGSECPARYCTSSSGTFCSRRSVTVVTRNECGEKWPGNPAAFSRRFIMRQMSIAVIAFLVSAFVLRYAVRKRRPSPIWAASIYSRRNCSRSCRTGISRDLPPFSDLSFGLFQDPETPENRGFLVYLGLLGLRGSSGTARKQPESTKLGPRKSESLVGGHAKRAEVELRGRRKTSWSLWGEKSPRRWADRSLKRSTCFPAPPKRLGVDGPHTTRLSPP